MGLLAAFAPGATAQTDTLYLRHDSTVVTSGDIADILLSANGFDSIVSLQFSINWNPEIAEFAGFSEVDLASTAIGVNEVSQGALRFSWFSPDGLPRSLPDNSRLLRLNFRAIGMAGQASPVSISGTPLAMQVFKGTPEPGGFIEMALQESSGLFQIAAPLAISIQSTDVSCFGDSTGTITFTTGADPDEYNFVWTNSAGTLLTPPLIDLPADDYNIVVINSNGIIVFQSTITIEAPASPLAIESQESTPASCDLSNGTFTTTAIGGTAPYNYTFAGSNNATGVFGSLAGGEYELRISDTNGCLVQDSVVIEQFVRPTVMIAGDSIQSLCGQTSIDLTASADQAVTFNWSDGSEGAIITVSTGGIYQVVATALGNCRDTAQIEVLDGNAVVAQLDSPLFPLCPGDSLDIMVSGGSEYNWFGDIQGIDNPSSSNIRVAPDSTTVFLVSVATSCSADTLSVPVEVFEITATAGPDTCIAPRAELELYASGGIFYTWADNPFPVSNPNIPDPIVQPELTTTYAVTIEDVNGCITDDDITVELAEDPASFITAVNAITPNGDGKNDYLEFRGAAKFGPNTLKIYSRWGRLVYNKIDYQQDDERFDGTYLGEPLPAGNYYYVLEFPTGTIKQTLVIIR